MGVMNRLRSRATITRAGSSDTDEKALTVMPAGRSPSSVVTTLIPVAKWPMTSRNRVGWASIAGSLRRLRPGALRSPKAREPGAHEVAEALEVRPQDGGPGLGQAVRTAPVLGRQGLDEAPILEPLQRRIQRAGAQRLAGEPARLGHDRVSVLGSIAQHEEDRQRRLLKPAEPGKLVRHAGAADPSGPTCRTRGREPPRLPSRRPRRAASPGSAAPRRRGPPAPEARPGG